MRIVITGSRHWPALANSVILEALIRLLRRGEPVHVIHGGAEDGADDVAEASVRALARRGYPITSEKVPADWSQGLGAGHARNARMVDMPDVQLVVAFRAPGKSNGTDGTIRHARRRKIPVLLYRPDGSYGFVTGPRVTPPSHPQ